MVRWLSPVVIVWACFLPPASAAPDNAAQKGVVEHKPPAIQYVTAFVAALLVLLILCKPSRKTYLED
jgi:hypothetical protein